MQNSQATPFFARLRGDRSGNMALMSAMMLPVLAGAGLGVIDYAGAARMKNHLQTAVDAATLAGGKMQSQMGDAELSGYVGDYIEQNLRAQRPYGQLGEVSHTVSRTDEQIQVDAEAEYETSVLDLFGMDTIEIEASSEVSLALGLPMEVVLVVDNSGSMNPSMDALREGMEQITELVMDREREPGDVKVGFVPYAMSVNIGPDAPREWLDVNGDNPTNGVNFENHNFGETRDCGDYRYQRWINGRWRWRWGYNPDVDPDTAEWCHDKFSPEKVNHIDLFENDSSISWGGCVEARPDGFDITDDAPNPADPSTMFVPFFYPDEYDNYALYSWMSDNLPDGYEISRNTRQEFTWNGPAPQNDQATGLDDKDSGIWAGNPEDAGWAYIEENEANATAYWRKYDNFSVSWAAQPGRGPNAGCQTPITALTFDRTTLSNAITATRGQGDIRYTGSSLGMAWGWRAISPGEPFSEGLPYGEAYKVVILMSDGESNLGWGTRYNTLMDSVYTPYGYMKPQGKSELSRAPEVNNIASNRLWSWQRDFLDDKLRAICEAMKDEGIEIYTILFDQSGRSIGAETRAAYQECASHGDDPMLIYGSEHFYEVWSEEQLVDVYQTIGKGLHDLRLTK